jgi:hypothetical protein
MTPSSPAFASPIDTDPADRCSWCERFIMKVRRCPTRRYVCSSLKVSAASRTSSYRKASQRKRRHEQVLAFHTLLTTAILTLLGKSIYGYDFKLYTF